MKPHPGIRKTIKWGGAAVTALLVVVWIGSERYFVFWTDSKRTSLSVFGGATTIGQASVPFNNDRGGWRSGQFPGAEDYRWVPRLEWGHLAEWPDGPLAWSILVPHWIPVSLLAVATTAAWLVDAKARRRERAARLNLCPTCKYDRAGLAAGAVCPECGAASK